jgi:DNA polymerase III epsilon subunit-like protein
MSQILSLVESSLDPAGLEEVLYGLTVRVDGFDRDRIDALCRFLGVSRQRFLRSAVEDALACALDALDDGGSPALDQLFTLLRSIDEQEAFESSQYL